MNASQTLHPTDQTLHAYGLGKLNDALARSVNQHVESCSDCQRRVAELSSDSFLGRLRDAQGWPGSPAAAMSSNEGQSVLGAGTGSPAPPTASTMPPGLADHPDYEITRELGRGGMGVVYMARNTLMGRTEVLKVVSSHLINRRGVLDRFLAEIRNAARLDHPNVVTAYSVLRVGETLILAMQYVEGLDLAQIVKTRGPLPVVHTCNYVHQAELGLQHAHEHGMVHRDIKPSNLMLARQGNRPLIKVLDFGLAKVQSEGAADGGLTHEGQMLGTRDYIAPEQISDARRADIRADIYSLGCTFYYLLTGGPPFQGTSLYDILQAHHSMDAKPLNLKRPEVPMELAALVAKMMAKEPERRFQAPKEVAQALLPFFKKGSVASAGQKPEFSQAERPDAKQATAAAGSVPTRPEAASEPAPGPLVRKPVGTSPADVSYESLVVLRGTEWSQDKTPAAAVDRGSTRRSWPLVAAAVLFGFVALSIIVITIRNKNGEIKIVASDDKPFEADADGVHIEFNPSTTKLKGDANGSPPRPEVDRRAGKPADKEVVAQSPTAPPIPAASSSTQATFVAGNKAGKRDANDRDGNERARPEAKDTARSPNRSATRLTGSWVVKGDELSGSWVVEGDELTGNMGIILLGNSPLWRYDIKFKAQIVKGDRFWAIFHYSSPSDYCMLEVGDNNGREVTLQLFQNGKRRSAESRSIPTAPGRWYDVRIEVNGPKFKFYRGDNELFTYVDEHFTKGRVGLAVGSVALFKDIVITNTDRKTVWVGPPNRITTRDGRIDWEGPPDAPAKARGKGVAPANAGERPEAGLAVKAASSQDSIENSIGMTLNRIPDGTFLMGSPDDDKDADNDEKPRHRVRITRPFYLGVYEVTQAQYEAVMGNNPSLFSANGVGKDRVADQSTDRHPVEQVSWLDAVKFCNQLSEMEGRPAFYEIDGEKVRVADWNRSGYRLPTEAEREYACRANASSLTRFSFGDDVASLGEFAWYSGNSDNKTHSVGEKRPNRWGLFDMNGNVSEWCWDGYGESHYKESREDDPRGLTGASSRVYRGGGWHFDPRFARSAFRSRIVPGCRSVFLGFRLALVQSGL